jgi:putative transposase
MLILLSVLLSGLCSMFRSRAALKLENMALRHQIGVLKRSAGKRPKLTAADRLFWVFLSRVWCGWRAALDIVQPATAIAWHRKGFRLFWTWKIRHGRKGRPAVSSEVRAADKAITVQILTHYSSDRSTIAGEELH